MSLHPLLQDVPLSKFSLVSTKADTNQFHLHPQAAWSEVLRIIINSNWEVKPEISWSEWKKAQEFSCIHLPNHFANNIAKTLMPFSAKIDSYRLHCVCKSVQRHLKFPSYTSYWSLSCHHYSLYKRVPRMVSSSLSLLLHLFFFLLASSSYIIHTHNYEAARIEGMQKCFL